MRLLSTFLLAACAPVGDASDGEELPEKECGNGLWGERFVSEDELECGLGADGAEVYCNWSLEFGEGVFTWGHSDVTESGTVTGADTALAGVTEGGESVSGTFHRTTARVTWAGDVFESAE